jgi:hypothetical protein
VLNAAEAAQKVRTVRHSSDKCPQIFDSEVLLMLIIPDSIFRLPLAYDAKVILAWLHQRAAKADVAHVAELSEYNISDRRVQAAVRLLRRRGRIEVESGKEFYREHPPFHATWPGTVGHGGAGHFFPKSDGGG